MTIWLNLYHSSFFNELIQPYITIKFDGDEETDSKSITSKKNMSSLFSLVNLQLINTLDLLISQYILGIFFEELDFASAS